MRGRAMLRAGSIVALVVGAATAIPGFVAWSEFRRYTATSDGIVVERTPDRAKVRIEGAISGGRGAYVLDYATLSGSGSSRPPADGPRFEIGDRVPLVHPPLELQKARLASSLMPPRQPYWTVWAGAGTALVAATVLACSTSRTELQSFARDAVRCLRIAVQCSAGFALGMHLGVLIHEFGHALGSWVGGDRVDAIVIHSPMPAGRVDPRNGESPLYVWGGVAFGAVGAVVPLLLVRRFPPRSPVRFAAQMTAGLGLAHNAMYLVIGSIAPYGDATDMLALGAPRWLLFVLGCPLLIVSLAGLTAAVRSLDFRATDAAWKRLLVVECGFLSFPLAVFWTVLRAGHSDQLPWFLGGFAACFAIVVGLSLLRPDHEDDAPLRSEASRWWATLGLAAASVAVMLVEAWAFPAR